MIGHRHRLHSLVSAFAAMASPRLSVDPIHLPKQIVRVVAPHRSRTVVSFRPPSPCFVGRSHLYVLRSYSLPPPPLTHPGPSPCRSFYPAATLSLFVPIRVTSIVTARHPRPFALLHLTRAVVSDTLYFRSRILHCKSHVVFSLTCQPLPSTPP